MDGRRGGKWLSVLAPLLICLPCLLGPAALVGATAAGAAAVSAAIGGWLVGTTVLLLGVALAAVLYRRRPTRGKCPR